MLHLLKRHPFPVSARFGHSLVLTYAYPEEILRPLLPPGLQLDTYRGYGFVAVALVQTKELRPAFLPRFLGQDFFLAGYRIFARFGKALRGLYILRSDTDRQSMARMGNLFTQYRYHLCKSTCVEHGAALRWEIRTRGGVADILVTAELGSAALPEGSPFSDLKTARRFAGPLPYTFDFEKQTHRIIAVRGVRAEWDPQPVRVKVEEMTYLRRFGAGVPLLANAFHLHNISYRWERGQKLDATAG